MPTSLRLSREQCERAFAQFILERRAGTVAAVPVLVRKGEVDPATGRWKAGELDDIPLPSIVVSCPGVRPHQTMGYPLCELHVMSLTSSDKTGAGTKASDQFGFLAELFPDQDVDRAAYDAVLLAMSKPVSGPDTRKVQDFRLMAYFLTDDQGAETDRHWIDHLIFEVHCLPTDDADGDGQP